jgi:ProQ/FINO family
MTMPQDSTERGEGGRTPKIGFQDLARQLVAAGLPLPVPLQRAVAGDVRPVAVGSREAWAAWAAERGYDAGQVETLLTALAKLTHSGAYRMGLASDLSERHDVDGQAVEAVGPFDRHSAALIEHARALHDAAKAAKELRGGVAPRDTIRLTRPSPPLAASPAAVPPPAPKPTSSHLGALSAGEMLRRQAALAAASRR